MMHFEELSRTAARARVRREDLARERYVKKYFRETINKPLRFHLVINTDKFSDEEAAHVIAEGLLQLSGN